MPFIRNDEDGFEETDDGCRRHTGPFNYYVPAKVAYEPYPFDPASLTHVAATMHSALVGRGATRFRVTYDGGHDEGFAHADNVWFGEDTAPRSAGDVADAWARDAGLLAELDGAARRRHAENIARYQWMPKEYSAGDWTPKQIVHDALDELAQIVASSILGNGFGTGEYSIYGACVLDVRTNEVTDDPEQPMPRNVTLD